MQFLRKGIAVKVRDGADQARPVRETFRGFIQVIVARPRLYSQRESGLDNVREELFGDTPIISTKGLRKMYGPHLALDDINLRSKGQ